MVIRIENGNDVRVSMAIVLRHAKHLLSIQRARKVTWDEVADFFGIEYRHLLAPLAAFMVEERTWLKRVFLGVTVFGAAYGLSLFVPLVINPDWLSIEIAQGSIVYDTRLIYDDFVSKSVLRIVYASVICLPLLASTAPGVRSFGRMVMLSVLLAFLFALYAFTSIWCYLAAVASAYVSFIMFRLPKRAQRRGHWA